MAYAIITKDKPGSRELRESYQSAHKRYLDEHKHLLLAAGAMLDDGGEKAHGGVLLVDMASRKEVEEFVKNDPFYKVELFEEVMISRWRKAFFNFERLVDL